MSVEAGLLWMCISFVIGSVAFVSFAFWIRSKDTTHNKRHHQA